MEVKTLGGSQFLKTVEIKRIIEKLKDYSSKIGVKYCSFAQSKLKTLVNKEK